MLNKLRGIQMLQVTGRTIIDYDLLAIDRIAPLD